MMNPRRLNVRHVRRWFETEADEIKPAYVSHGQVLVMFALFLTGLISMLGMATDLGYAFSQRRSSQNAADAAALAGARAVVEQQAAESVAAATASSNSMQSTTMTMTACWYVNDSLSASNLGACSGAPPAGTTGVHTEVQESHNTFFMRVLGINTVTTSAEATANVQLLEKPPGNGPFMVCGLKTKEAAGGAVDLVTQVGGVWQLNPVADGKIFKVHGPQVEDCGLQSSDWKGIAWQDYNEDAVVPGWWLGDNGDQAGPIRENVRGPSGCDIGATSGCVMILPIAIDNPEPIKDMGGVTGGIGMYVVAYGAFYVVETGSNTHDGTFMYEYSLKGPGTPGWTPGSGKLITIRLTE